MRCVLRGRRQLPIGKWDDHQQLTTGWLTLPKVGLYLHNELCATKRRTLSRKALHNLSTLATRTETVLHKALF